MYNNKQKRAIKPISERVRGGRESQPAAMRQGTPSRSLRTVRSLSSASRAHALLTDTATIVCIYLSLTKKHFLLITYSHALVHKLYMYTVVIRHFCLDKINGCYLWCVYNCFFRQSWNTGYFLRNMERIHDFFRRLSASFLPLVNCIRVKIRYIVMFNDFCLEQNNSHLHFLQDILKTILQASTYFAVAILVRNFIPA